ncbi:Helix-turn-helix domain-containing protein [Nakamurella panacisegetis]|uniref:Helix-turn-helix domain-containing protein n=1 Tax=Nakamurella panacisegetis TaxID=1090615 RepID=A0A1H0RWR1_9ACTN|nr:helix-turn-helix transcriptional regulator [Nakamurella panacisegetis]SDP34032.1 Helix-turn-helix domain-containing protein [Nakamurella panacisegetis]
MDNGSEVHGFLVSRRGRITPADAGLVDDRTLRRVPGLRRREVAVLAGVSVEYYTRLERGNLRGASDSVLDSIGRALQLDEAERAHLFDLARAQGAPRKRARHRPQQVRPEVQATLDAFTGGPAFVRNGRLDVLGTNLLGRAVYEEMFQDRIEPPNLARFAFLDDRARRFYPDWDRAADDTVAILRSEAGREPYDEDLTALVGVLSTRSSEFRQRWAAHNVKQHYSGKKHFHHPDVGDLYLAYQALDLFAEQGLSLLVYTPQPGTGTDEALRLLASWSATPTNLSADTSTAAAGTSR